MSSFTLKRDRGDAAQAGADEAGAGKAGSGATAEAKRQRRKRRAVRIAAASVLAETAALRLRGYNAGANVVVRCREGHVFTTIWVPGASLKAVRLGWWRYQRCPVGGHWSWVTPVRQSDLSWRQRRSAAKHRDVRIP